MKRNYKVKLCVITELASGSSMEAIMQFSVPGQNSVFLQDYFQYETSRGVKRGLSDESAQKIQKWLKENE